MRIPVDGAALRLSESKTFWTPLVLALGLSLCLSKDVSAQYSAQDYYGAAIGLMAQNNWTQASQYLEAALKLEPGNVNAWKRLGECQEKMGQYKASLASYEKALSLAPGDSEAQSRVESVRGQAAQSISKETGLAGAGEAKKEPPQPGWTFNVGPGLDILSQGALTEHVNTSYYMYHSATFLTSYGGLSRFNPYSALDYAPSWSLKSLNKTATGSSRTSALGYHFRLQGSFRRRINDGFYAQFSGSAQYQAAQSAGYEAVFEGELSDDSGLFTASSSSSKPISISETWKTSAAVIAVGPSLGLHEEESGKLLNRGSLGLELLLGQGWLGYRSDLDSASGSSSQEASLGGLGIGLGTRVELVKTILGVPLNLEGGYRWLSIRSLTGTLSTSDQFNSGSRTEDYDVTAVSIPYSYTDTGAFFLNFGDVARFATGAVPDEVPRFVLNLGGFNLALSARVGF